jgi:hypothetical protein
MKIEELEDSQKLVTKLDIAEMHKFLLDRETALIWKVIALQVTLIGAITGAFWGAITFTLTHWKP